MRTIFDIREHSYRNSPTLFFFKFYNSPHFTTGEILPTIANKSNAQSLKNKVQPFNALFSLLLANNNITLLCQWFVRKITRRRQILDNELSQIYRKI